MLTSRRLTSTLLEIRETVYSPTRTMHKFWYYDTYNWKVSSFGKEGDTPDRPMRQSQIDWVKARYL